MGSKSGSMIIPNENWEEGNADTRCIFLIQVIMMNLILYTQIS
jgi:hypothetical protein